MLTCFRSNSKIHPNPGSSTMRGSSDNWASAPLSRSEISSSRAPHNTKHPKSYKQYPTSSASTIFRERFFLSSSLARFFSSRRLCCSANRHSFTSLRDLLFLSTYTCDSAAFQRFASSQSFCSVAQTRMRVKLANISNIPNIPNHITSLNSLETGDAASGGTY